MLKRHKIVKNKNKRNYNNLHKQISKRHKFSKNMIFFYTAIVDLFLFTMYEV